MATLNPAFVFPSRDDEASPVDQTQTPTGSRMSFRHGRTPDYEDTYTLVTNLILAQYNKGPLPWSIKAQLQGRPGPEANHIFQTWANLPLTQEEYREKQAALQKENFPKCKPLPGAAALLDGLRAANVDIALATSSMQGNFYLKTDHLKQFMSAFSQDRRVLGDDPRIPKGRGKPAPDIYLVALETINESLRAKGQREIKANECLVFEDSVPGVEAGRRAGMRVVWVPHPELLNEFKGKEDAVLAGLTGSAGDLDAVEDPKKLVPEKAEAGWPGKTGDGWAERLTSLEDFDYSKYGIKVPVNSKV